MAEVTTQDIQALTGAINDLKRTIDRSGVGADMSDRKKSTIEAIIRRESREREKASKFIAEETKERINLKKASKDSIDYLFQLNKTIQKTNNSINSFSTDWTRELAQKSTSAFDRMLSGFEDSVLDVEGVLKRAKVGNLESLIEQQKQIEALREASKELEKTGMSASDVSEVFEKLKKDGIDLGHGTVDLGKELRKRSAQLAQDTTQAQQRFQIENSVAESVKKTLEGFFSFRNAIRLATLAATNFYIDLKGYAKAGMVVGKGEGYGKVETQALRLGISGKEYAEMSAANRQAIVSMGGTSAAFDQLQPKITEYVGLVGDLSDTSKFLYGSMTTLVNAGVKPSTATLDGLKNSFVDLHKMVGMTTEEFNNNLVELTEDTDIRQKIRASSQQEREAIIKGLAARLKENVAMGMSTKQAMEAAKAMGRLAGESPLERVKRGAKMAAMAGAMGIQGGGELMQLTIKGQRRTKEETDRMQGIMSNVANAVQQTATGELGAEVMATTLTEKMGLQDVFGKDSPLITLGNEQKKLQQGMLENLQLLVGTAGGKAIEAVDMISNGIARSPVVQILGAILAAVGAIAAGRMLSKFGGLGNIVGGAGKGISAGVGSVFGGGAGMGMLKGAGIGLGAGAAVLGARAMTDETSTAGKLARSNLVSGAAMGAMLGPWGAAAGGLIGGGMDVYDMMKGPSDASETATDSLTTTSTNTSKISDTMVEMQSHFRGVNDNTKMLVELQQKLIDVSVAQLDILTSDNNKSAVRDKYQFQPSQYMIPA